MTTALKFRPGTSDSIIATRTAIQATIDKIEAGAAVSVEERWAKCNNAFGARLAGERDGDPVIEFYGATEGKKRDRSIFRVDGAKLVNLAENPRFMFAHQYAMLPIGNIIVPDIRRAVLRNVGKALVMPVTKLRTKGDHPHLRFADLTFDMYANRDMDTVSLGWAIEKARQLTDGDGYNDGFEYLESDVLELSAAPIPVDAQATTVKAAALVTEVLQRGFAHVCKSEEDREILVRGFMARGFENTDSGVYVPRAALVTLSELSVGGELVEEPAEPATPARVAEGGTVVPPAVIEGARVLAAAEDAAEVRAVAARVFPGLDYDALVRGLSDGVAAATDEPAAVLVVDEAPWDAFTGRAYDITREQFEPSSEELRIAARYLDVEVRDMCVTGTWVPRARLGAWLTALEDTLQRWAIDDVRNFDYSDNELPPVHRVLQLNSKRRASFLVGGTRFMSRKADEQTPGGERLVVRVETYGGCEVTVWGTREQQQLAEEFIEATWVKSREYKFLKGEAMTASGDFIERGEQTLDTIFVEERNETATKRVVELVNRGEFESRGYLFQGPPGTGKTLSARALKDECREATFILASARDFHYAYADSVVMHAYDVAAENTPAIVVFEDCEEYISHCMELLKQELDGMQQRTGIITVFTTNHPARFPEAMRDRPGRIHEVLNFGLPDAAIRARMIAAWMPDLDEAGRARAVEATEGYSGAHIREFSKYVEVLRAEESLEPAAAVERALEKLAEQRELVTQALTRTVEPSDRVRTEAAVLRAIETRATERGPRGMRNRLIAGASAGKRKDPPRRSAEASPTINVNIAGLDALDEADAATAAGRAVQLALLGAAARGELGPELQQRVAKTLSAATRAVIGDAITAAEAAVGALRTLLENADKAPAPATDDPAQLPAPEVAGAAILRALQDPELAARAARIVGEPAGAARYGLSEEALRVLHEGLARLHAREGAQQ